MNPGEGQGSSRKHGGGLPVGLGDVSRHHAGGEPRAAMGGLVWMVLNMGSQKETIFRGKTRILFFFGGGPGCVSFDKSSCLGASQPEVSVAGLGQTRKPYICWVPSENSKVSVEFR